MQSFTVEQRDTDNGYREILVSGELDLAVAGHLDEAIEAVGDDCRGILIGLADCEFIDSTGLAVILRAHRRLADEGRRLVVCSPGGQVQRILEVAGLTENGLVFDSVEAAL